MKLYAIKWKDEDPNTIGKDRWFKSFGCMISSITHFEGRVVEGICVALANFNIYWTKSDHAGKTGMELKLWWAEQQEPAEPIIRLRHSCEVDMLSDCPACEVDRGPLYEKPWPVIQAARIRARAIEIAREAAKAKPESYYAEPFQPHEWVIDAISQALTEGGAA